MIFGPELSVAIASAEYALATDGVKAWLVWCTPAGVVQIIKSTNQVYGLTTATPVVIDTNAANTDVQLNESFAIDPVTHALHVFWSRNSGSAGTPCSLMYSTSTDDGATWSAAATLDSGVSNGNNRFHRLGCAAYNGVVQAVYSSIDSAAFTTDGLWSIASVNGGASWSAPAKLYTSPVEVGEPNAAIGDDGSMHISWYDSGVNSNVGGDIYYARGAWDATGFQWQAAPTRVTVGQVCGRSRVASSRGVVMLTMNTNWGGAVADVATVRSADNGLTWGAIVTQAVHGAGPLTHPWLDIDSDHAALIWYDTSNNPSAGVYGFRVSTDAGATWANGPTAMPTTLATADAPKILFTNDLAWTFGLDASGNVIFAALPLFSPDPASAPVIDSFTRADENPLSDGGKWSQEIIAGTQLKLVSDQVQRQAASGTFGRSGSYRNDSSIAEGDAFVTLADNGGADGEFGLYLMDQTSKNGYSADLKNNLGSTAIFLNRLDAGVATQLGTTSAFGAVTGDKYLLRVTPNDVILLRFVGASGDWEELFRVRDTTYRSAVPIGLDLVGFNGEPIADDVGGGTLLAPSNTVLPSASGAVAAGSILSVTKGTWSVAQGATPARYSYQWQSSVAGAGSWTNVPLATLPFMTVADPTRDYQCVVTASTSFGTGSASSNTLIAASLSVAAMLSTAMRPSAKGLSGRVAMAMRARIQIQVPSVTSATFTTVASGGLQSGGAAAIDRFLTISGAGGLQSGGVGRSSLLKTIAAIGGLQSAGTAPMDIRYAVRGAGGLQSGGAASVQRTGVIVVIASGGLQSGGGALIDVLRQAIASGGLRASGAAPSNRLLKHLASGGLQSGGSSIVSVRVVVVPLGGLLSSGAGLTRFATGALLPMALVATLRIYPQLSDGLIALPGFSGSLIIKPDV